MKRIKLLRRCLFTASLLSLISSIFMDILILNGKISPFIIVSNNYIDSVFSGNLTFSTLSISLLTIIVGIVDTKIYGLKIREILSFDSAPIKFIPFIVFSMLLTLSSVVALAFELCTLITFIAIISIVYISVTSIVIFKVVTDVNLTKRIVLAEIKTNSIALSNYEASWINEYNNALISNNKMDIEIYAEILKKCIENKQLYENIKKYLPELFETACKYHSFSDSVSYIFDLIGLYSEKEGICKNYINHIQYYDESELLNSNPTETLISILSSPHLLNREKAEFAYCLFNAIISNDISDDMKLAILKKQINIITTITENQNGSVKSDLIMQIIIKNVIFADINASQELYDMLLKSLYINNLSNHEKIYINTMAKIFRALYFYGVLDKKIFNEEKHKSLQALAQRKTKIDDFVKISIGSWFVLHREEFLHFYIQDSFEFEHFIEMKNDALDIMSHFELWDYNNKIKFALWFYLSGSLINTDFITSEDIMEWYN